MDLPSVLIAVVPLLALVPILAHTSMHGTTHPVWEHALAVPGALVGVFLVGRYLLPAALAWVAKRRDMQLFGIIAFLAVFAAAWVMDFVGVSMTLGAFLIGMLLFGREVMDGMGVPEEEINDVIESFRGDNYALVRASANSMPAQE